MRLRLYHHHDGARVAYREYGAGPPLALLHSGLLSHMEWEPVVEHLGDRFRLVLPDLPLHGDSEARPRHPYTPDWFAEVIAAFCAEVLGPHPLIGGHGAGAEILLRAIAGGRLEPSRVVLMPNRMHAPPTRPRRRRGVAAAHQRGRRAGSRRPALLRRGAAVQAGVGGAPVEPRTTRRRPTCCATPSPTSPATRASPARGPSAPATGPAGAQTQLLDLYPRLRMPVLLLWADQDRIHPLGAAEEALPLLGDGQLRVLPEHRLPDGLRRSRRARPRAGGLLRIGRLRIAAARSGIGSPAGGRAPSAYRV